MRRDNSRGVLKLFLFLMAGVIIGGLIGHFLSLYFDLPIFRESITLGTGETPLSLNLIFADIIIGINIIINFGTVLGILLGVLFYTKS
jgi:hypothetical protein